MVSAQEIDQKCDMRIQGIIDWVRANKAIISQNDKLEIVINMSGESVKGSIKVFPVWGRE